MEAPFVTLNNKRVSRSKSIAIVALAVVGALVGCYMVVSTNTSQVDMLSAKHELHGVYTNWKAEHNKTFAPHEDKVRAQIFANTYKKIEQHNANPENKWTMGLGPFSAMTPEEFEMMHFIGQDSLANGHKNGIVREEHTHRVHHNETHVVHRNESHIHHNNDTKIVHEHTHIAHPNGTHTIHHHVVHIDIHTNKTVFEHTESHSTHSHAHHAHKTHFVSHSATHRVIKNDTHVITKDRTHTVHHNHTHVIIRHEVNTHNAEGKERTEHNETHVHANGSRVHHNHTHTITPKDDHVVFHNESHVVHANGTHKVHHKKTEWFHNGTFVIHETDLASKSSNGNIDWTRRGVIAPVRNQAGCGACYAFAAIAGADSARAIAGHGIAGLSEQQIIDCAKGGALNGCHGGDIPHAWDYIISHGLQNNKNYPYISGDGNDNHPCRSSNGPYKIKSYEKVSPANNVAASHQALLHSPLSIGLWVEGWQNYKGGVFNGCKVQQGMHAVQIVGIQDGVWKIKNSWGAGWGEHGFIRLAPGNTCSVTRDNMWAKA